MKKVRVEVDLTTTIRNGKEVATAILRRDDNLGLKLGMILAYSEKGRYGLMHNVRKFFTKYLVNYSVDVDYYIDDKLRLLTGEIRYAGRDLWGYDIELKGNQSPYD